MPRIPAPVIAEVAAVISQYYTHSQIDNLFARLGVPHDDFPNGLNKLDKVTVWLRLANEDVSADAHAVLGGAIEEFMDRDLDRLPDQLRPKRAAERERVRQALAKHGLSYQPGGLILGGTLSTPTRSLEELIRERNLTAIQKEFDRALDNVETDPHYRCVRGPRVHV